MKKPLHVLAGLAGLLLSALPAAAQGSLNMVVRRQHLWDQSGDLSNGGFLALSSIDAPSACLCLLSASFVEKRTCGTLPIV